MAIVPTFSQSLSTIFPPQHQTAIMKVYNEIPGTLGKFLQEQNVVEKFEIDDTLFTQGELGTEKQKTWDKFRMDLRSSIKAKLDAKKIKGIKPEELSDFISSEYLKKCPYWAKRGEILSGIVQLNKAFSDQHHRYVNAYIYARITEECEDNVFSTNKYKYTYYVSLDVKGILINQARALQFSELVAKDSEEAIKNIKSTCELTWSGFLKA